MSDTIKRRTNAKLRNSPAPLLERYERASIFKPGELWMSPRGSYYRVMACVIGGHAVLRLGKDGDGKIQRRRWDAVLGWVLQPEDTLLQ